MMAAATLNQAAIKAIAKKQSPEQDAGSMHRHAIALLDELDLEQNKVYAVAAAGRAYVRNKDATESHLFTVIEDLLAEVVLTNALREVVANLAERAGSTWVKEVAA